MATIEAVIEKLEALKSRGEKEVTGSLSTDRNSVINIKDDEIICFCDLHMIEKDIPK